MSRVDEIVNMIQFVQPFPKVAQRVMAMIEDPQVTARALAEVILYDQVITANILKISNASYFGLPRKVTSLEEALVLVGQDILMDMIIASCSAKFFRGKIGAGYDLEQGDLWKHSVAVAILAKLLAQRMNGVDTGTAFTIGLLHDIGKRFLSNFVANEFQEIMATVESEQCSFAAAEKQILGITHAELGGMILKKWEFPADMIEAVEEHHNPKALSGSVYAGLTAVSNTIVISMGIGVGADGLATELQAEGMQKFALSPADVQLLMIDLMMELDKAEELLNL